MVDLVAQSGLIESVWTQNAGVVLATDATAGDTVLSVESTDVLETETGTGQVKIGATVYDYTVDPDALTVTLGSSLAANAGEGDRVESYPLAPATLARVSLDTGDSVTVRVAAAHVLLLADGDRDGGEREFVTLYREGENYVTLDVPNATATVKGGRIDDSAGDLDPDADVIYLDGPPTHYRRIDWDPDNPNLYVDFATMEATAGSAWAAAVSALEFDNGTLSIPDTFVVPDGGTTNAWVPVWMFPTNGQPCRVLVDSVEADPATLPAIVSDPGYDRFSESLYLRAELVPDSLSVDEKWEFDDLFFQHFFWDGDVPANVGAFFRGWEAHMSEFSDVRADLPADADPDSAPENFQADPLQSLNQTESGATIETYPNVGVLIDLPVYGWSTAKPSEVQGEYAINLTGVRLVRG